MLLTHELLKDEAGAPVFGQAFCQRGLAGTDIAFDHHIAVVVRPWH